MKTVVRKLFTYLPQVTSVALTIELVCIALLLLARYSPAMWLVGVLIGIVTFTIHISILYVLGKYKESDDHSWTDES